MIFLLELLGRYFLKNIIGLTENLKTPLNTIFLKKKKQSSNIIFLKLSKNIKILKISKLWTIWHLYLTIIYIIIIFFITQKCANFTKILFFHKLLSNGIHSFFSKLFFAQRKRNHTFNTTNKNRFTPARPKWLKYWLIISSLPLLGNFYKYASVFVL